MAYEAQSPALAEAAKARAAFAEIHGPSQTLGNITWYKNSFRGTLDDVAYIQTTQQHDDFQKQFPHHRVFVDGREIVGSISRDLSVGTKPYKEQVAALQDAVSQRGITLFDCAIISTGPEEAELKDVVA